MNIETVMLIALLATVWLIGASVLIFGSRSGKDHACIWVIWPITLPFILIVYLLTKTINAVAGKTK